MIIKLNKKHQFRFVVVLPYNCNINSCNLAYNLLKKIQISGYKLGLLILTKQSVPFPSK